VQELNTIKLGDASFSIEATGSFKDTDANGYVPNPESEKLRVDIPNFDGPLDLLLFLIKKHSLNILDIPIVLITEKYLEMLKHIQAYDFDIAGEFILMAATLAQIKSRLLLPKDPSLEGNADEDVEDPRAALVRQLMEYQKFKAAAQTLGGMHQLGRDFFKRPTIWAEEFRKNDSEPEKVEACHSFELLQLFADALKKAQPGTAHIVQAESLSISAYIRELMDYGRLHEAFSFDSATGFLGSFKTREIVVVFLAMLEMARLGFLRITQDFSGDISLFVNKENLWTADKPEDFLELDY